MSTFNIGAYVLGVLAGQGDDAPGWGKARRYCGSARAAAEVRQVWKHNIKSVMYEILPRAAGDAAHRSFTVEAFQGYLAHMTGSMSNLLTPEEIRVKLLNTRFRHSYTPNWDRFDFGGMVYRLAAWLAYATWRPKTNFSHMSEKKKMVLLGMNNPEETYGLNDDRVYISQAVTRTGQAATFWALAWAAAGSGATVLTDHVVLTTDYAAKVKDFSGGKAWFGAVEALAILAEYYNQAGAGDVFAVHMFGGLHAVNTVVGHSDEGGLLRDIWRKIRVAECFGGLPRECVRSNQIPSLAVNTSYRALTTWVDAYTLLSAAAVAHCDPLVEVGTGVYFPTVIESGGEAPGLARIRQIGGVLEQSMGRFFSNYTRALTLLVGGEADGVNGYADAILSVAASELLVGDHNRHLDYDVVAPYFWIEPTTILKRNMFGTLAESEGWGSYGASSEVHRMHFFEKAMRTGTCSDFKSEWITYFHGARKCGAILFLQGQPADGLAFLRPIQFDANNLCLSGSGRPELELLEQGSPISTYLWTRGQSGFPHPAELLNLSRTMMWRVSHYSADINGVKYSKNVPLSDEIEKVEIVMTFNRLEQLEPDVPNTGTGQLRRERKLATAALSHAAEIMCVASGRPLVDNAVQNVAPVFPNAILKEPGTVKESAPGPYDALVCQTGLQASTTKDHRANVVGPTLQHESLRAPQLARTDTRPQGVAIQNQGATALVDDSAGALLTVDQTFATATGTTAGAANQAGQAPGAGAQPAVSP